MIHKHWCKSCGARIEATDGGYCYAEECRSIRATEAKRALGVFRSGETREDVLKRLDEAIAKSPHNGGLKIARRGVKESGFELLAEGVLANALAQLGYAAPPPPPFTITAQAHPPDRVYTPDAANGGALKLSGAPPREVALDPRVEAGRIYKVMYEAFYRHQLYSSKLLDHWTGLHLDVFADRFMAGYPTQPYRGPGPEPDSFFREHIQNCLAACPSVAPNPTDLRAFLWQSITSNFGMPRESLLLFLQVPGDGCAHTLLFDRALAAYGMQA